MVQATAETVRVNFRANSDAKRESERVLRAMGLNLSDGLNMFLARVAAEHRVPFPLAMTREEILGADVVALGESAARSISEEVNQRVADGAPVAQYDRTLGKAYVEHADGHRDYVDQ